MPYQMRILYPSQPVNRGHPLARGLVGWWLAHPLLNGAGSRWLDLTQGHIGTVTSVTVPPTATSGWGRSMRRGGWGEMRFDGTADHVQVPTNSAFNIVASQGLTLSAWIKMTTTPCVFVERIGAADVPYYALTVGNNCAPGKLGLEVRGATSGETACCSTTSVNNGVWQHVVGVRNTITDTLVVYVNGKSEASVTDATVGDLATTGKFWIGCHGSGVTDSPAGEYLNGQLDDVRMYSRAFSASEVAAMYANSLQGYPGLLNSLSLRHMGAWAAAPAALFRPFQVMQAVNRSYRY